MSKSIVIVVLSLLSISSPLDATSVVIFRVSNGSTIIVAADSQFSLDKAKPLLGCKIAQIEHNYWTALSGIAVDTAVKFSPYQIALAAASHYRNSLDGIANEVQLETLAPLQLALKHQRKVIGEKAFWRQYKDGDSVHTQAFWGLENGILRVIYINFILHGGRRELVVRPEMHQCPGDACPGPADEFAVFLGHRKAIDEFTAANKQWMNDGEIEMWAKRFVQMEIDEDADCHCSPPVDVLRIDRLGLQSWVGDVGPLCQQPH